MLLSQFFRHISWYSISLKMCEYSLEVPQWGTSNVNEYQQYGKCPKILNTLFHTFFTKIFLFMQLFLKIVSGMANSIDPDQTAPSEAVWSGSTLFAYAILSEILVYEITRHLPHMFLLRNNTFWLKEVLSKVIIFWYPAYADIAQDKALTVFQPKSTYIDIFSYFCMKTYRGASDEYLRHKF